MCGFHCVGEVARCFLLPGPLARPFCPLPGPEDSCEAYRHVLGQNKVSYEVRRFHGDEERFFVEGLSFPDAGFSGLLTFHVTLLDDSNEVGAARTDRVGNGLPARRGRCPRRGGSWPPAAASPETKELAACLSPQWSLTKPGAGPRGQSASPPVSTCRISPSPPSSPTAWCSEWPPGS